MVAGKRVSPQLWGSGTRAGRTRVCGGGGVGGTEGVEPGRGRDPHSTLIQYSVTERSPCSWQHAGDRSHEHT